MKTTVAAARRRQWHPTPVLLPGKIPGTEEPGGLQSMGSRRVGQDWVTSLSLFTFMYWRRKWQPTPVFLPGESQGWGAWWAAVYGVAQSRTRLKWLSLLLSRQILYHWVTRETQKEPKMKLNEQARLFSIQTLFMDLKLKFQVNFMCHKM